MFSNKANSATKKKILQAIALSDNGEFAINFADKDFIRLPHSNNRIFGRTYWTSHIGDVTVLVWDRGKDVRDWIVQFQTW